MPFTADQLKLFGIALAIKRGETSPGFSAAAARIARRTTEEKLKEMIAEGVVG